MIFGIYNLCGKSQADFLTALRNGIRIKGGDFQHDAYASCCNALEKWEACCRGGSYVAKLYAASIIDATNFLDIMAKAKDWTAIGKERPFFKMEAGAALYCFQVAQECNPIN